MNLDPNNRSIAPADRAVTCFAEGWACSQAVLLAFAPRYGLDAAQASRLASGFAGGIGRTGRTCGAITGAVMVLGLHAGDTDNADRPNRDVAVALARELFARFTAEHGSIACQALLGYDLSSDEQRAAARDAGAFATLCPKFVRRAAEITEELIERSA